MLATAALAAALIASQALALDFKFSFDGTNGTLSGTVTGKIFGLLDNATSPATDLMISSAPSAFGISTPYDMFPTTTAINFFTLLNGVIVDAQFLSGDPTGTFELGLNFAGQNNLKNPATATTYNNLGFAGATYTAIAVPAPVPEPVSASLLILGLAGLGLTLGRHTKRDRPSRSRTA
jgi:hypothetical protein